MTKKSTEISLFVYGTLRAEGILPLTELLDNRVAFVDDGSVKGRLFLVDYYPGLVMDPLNCYDIKGEVYSLLDKEDLAILDNYEGASNPPSTTDLFIKKKISVLLQKGSYLPCLVYLYNRKITPEMPEIRSGDYCRYIAK